MTIKPLIFTSYCCIILSASSFLTPKPTSSFSFLKISQWNPGTNMAGDDAPPKYEPPKPNEPALHADAGAGASYLNNMAGDDAPLENESPELKEPSHTVDAPQGNDNMALASNPEDEGTLSSVEEIVEKKVQYHEEINNNEPIDDIKVDQQLEKTNSELDEPKIVEASMEQGQTNNEPIDDIKVDQQLEKTNSELDKPKIVEASMEHGQTQEVSSVVKDQSVDVTEFDVSQALQKEMNPNTSENEALSKMKMEYELKLMEMEASYKASLEQTVKENELLDEKIKQVNQEHIEHIAKIETMKTESMPMNGVNGNEAFKKLEMENESKIMEIEAYYKEALKQASEENKAANERLAEVNKVHNDEMESMNAQFMKSMEDFRHRAEEDKATSILSMEKHFALAMEEMEISHQAKMRSMMRNAGNKDSGAYEAEINKARNVYYALEKEFRVTSEDHTRAMDKLMIDSKRTLDETTFKMEDEMNFQLDKLKYDLQESYEEELSKVKQDASIESQMIIDDLMEKNELKLHAALDRASQDHAIQLERMQSSATAEKEAQEQRFRSIYDRDFQSMAQKHKAEVQELQAIRSANIV